MPTRQSATPIEGRYVYYRPRARAWQHTLLTQDERNQRKEVNQKRSFHIRSRNLPMSAYDLSLMVNANAEVRCDIRDTDT